MCKRIKIEKTTLEEKESFVHVDEFDKTITITTHSNRVFSKLLKAYGLPHEVFPSVRQKSTAKCEYISGASWKFNYKDERSKAKPMLSMGNLLPHS